jgi:hypothetical protein
VEQETITQLTTVYLLALAGKSVVGSGTGMSLANSSRLRETEVSSNVAASHERRKGPVAKPAGRIASDIGITYARRNFSIIIILTS